MTYAKDATGPYYHGTRADLSVGDLLAPGFDSNYRERKLSWIYFSGTLDAAIWGCELARGEGRERIYIVEPTGPFEDDPNLTDKKFPGNPTQSYRSREALRIIGEVTEWDAHPPERLKEMKDFLARLEPKATCGSSTDRLSAPPPPRARLPMPRRRGCQVGSRSPGVLDQIPLDSGGP